MTALLLMPHGIPWLLRGSTATSTLLPAARQGWKLQVLQYKTSVACNCQHDLRRSRSRSFIFLFFSTQRSIQHTAVATHPYALNYNQLTYASSSEESISEEGVPIQQRRIRSEQCYGAVAVCRHPSYRSCTVGYRFHQYRWSRRRDSRSGQQHRRQAPTQFEAIAGESLQPFPRLPT